MARGQRGLEAISPHDLFRNLDGVEGRAFAQVCRPPPKSPNHWGGTSLGVCALRTRHRSPRGPKAWGIHCCGVVHHGDSGEGGENLLGLALRTKGPQTRCAPRLAVTHQHRHPDAGGGNSHAGRRAISCGSPPTSSPLPLCSRWRGSRKSAGRRLKAMRWEGEPASDSEPLRVAAACCLSSSMAPPPARDRLVGIPPLCVARDSPQCSGATAITIWVVEQLGMDMMPWCSSTSCPLISGTTRERRASCGRRSCRR